MDAFVWGASLALASAFFYAINKLLVRRGAMELELYAGILITQLLSVTYFGILILFLGQVNTLFTVSMHTLIILAFAGILDFVIARAGELNNSGMVMWGTSLLRFDG